jgi:hypothetical protein
MFTLYPEVRDGSDEGAVRTPTPALLVRVMHSGADEPFDWEAMESGRSSNDDSENSLRWLAPVLRRWFWLYDLKAVAARFGPSFPALGPLALEAAVTLPSTQAP